MTVNVTSAVRRTRELEMQRAVRTILHTCCGFALCTTQQAYCVPSKVNTASHHPLTGLQPALAGEPMFHSRKPITVIEVGKGQIEN